MPKTEETSLQLMLEILDIVGLFTIDYKQHYRIFWLNICFCTNRKYSSWLPILFWRCSLLSWCLPCIYALHLCCLLFQLSIVHVCICVQYHTCTILIFHTVSPRCEAVLCIGQQNHLTSNLVAKYFICITVMFLFSLSGSVNDMGNGWKSKDS